jgi:uncharacterized membrane protein YGL010W
VRMFHFIGHRYWQEQQPYFFDSKLHDAFLISRLYYANTVASSVPLGIHI